MDFGVIITIIGGIFWGFSGTCGQFLMGELGVAVLGLTKVRLLLGGLILTLLGLFFHPKETRKILSSPKDLAALGVFGLFGVSFNQLSYLTAISYSDAGTATVLQYLGPALLVLVMCIKEKRLPKPIEILSLFLAMVGTFVLVTGGDIHTLKLSGLGLFWGILAAVALVFYNILPEGLLRRYPTLVVTGIAMLFGGVVLTMTGRPSGVEALWSTSGLVGLAGLVLVGTVLSYSLYLHGVRLIGPVKASLIVCVEPVAAVLFSAVLLGQSFGIVDVCGMILILTAVVLLGRKA